MAFVHPQRESSVGSDSRPTKVTALLTALLGVSPACGVVLSTFLAVSWKKSLSCGVCCCTSSLASCLKLFAVVDLLIFDPLSCAAPVLTFLPLSRSVMVLSRLASVLDSVWVLAKRSRLPQYLRTQHVQVKASAARTKTPAPAATPAMIRTGASASCDVVAGVVVLLGKDSGTADALRVRSEEMQPIFGPDTRLKDTVNACCMVQFTDDFSQHDREVPSYEKKEHPADS
mmetsp:Transcript_151617/g.278492  ORF Transcript_151617/g.278492 Transcript_151617/m.278492 type:complete len:229 (+) Transcript_151617:207-893(+)